jgi:hypothetical protein
MNTKIMSYNAAKVYLKPLGLKSKEDYDAWWNANKPDFLPQFPEDYYGAKAVEASQNIDTLKPVAFNAKERTELIKKVTRLQLSTKENKLFQKILEKGFKNWNNSDLEFLTLLYDLHYNPTLYAFGMDIYPHEQTEKIRKETKVKQEYALQRFTEEPYASWFRNVRNYK